MNASGTWDPVASVGLAQTSGRLLTDHSLDASNIEDLFEQQTVGDVLIRAIDVSIGEMRGGGNVIGAKTFALYGRYGQGKSRVLLRIRDHFHRRAVTGPRFRVPVVVRNFSISNYKTDDLAENFDMFFEYRRIIWMIAFWIALTILGSYIISQTADAVDPLQKAIYACLGAAAAAVVAAALDLVSSVKFVWRDLLRSYRLWGISGRSTANAIMEWLLLVMGGAPALIIIDDLDRATTDQQQAILISLRRHRSALNSVILIAFDEEPLLTSMRDSTSPNELLVKTFDAAQRLAPMNAQDATDMAVTFCDRLMQINPECTFAERFFQPMIVGDFARVFYLHGNASARFAKKLINAVYLETCRMQLSDLHDISALIRVNGLFQYVPVMESDLGFIGFNLMDGSDELLVATAEKRLGYELQPDKKLALLNYLDSTRHMKPSHGGWQKILREWRGGLPGPAPSIATVDRVDIARWCQNDVAFAAEPDISLRRRLYAKSFQLPFSEPSVRSLRKSFDSEPSAGNADIWRAMLLRLCLYDRRYVDEMSWTKFARYVALFQQYGPLIAAPPLSVKRKGKGWGTIDQVVNHHHFFPGVLPTDNLQHNLRNAVEEPEGYFSAEQSDIGGIPNNEIVVATQIAWPGLDHAIGTLESEKTLASNFRALRKIIAFFPNDYVIAPYAHAEWIEDRLLAADYSTILAALLELLPQSFGESETDVWPAGSIVALLANDHVVGHRHRQSVMPPQMGVGLADEILRILPSAPLPDPLVWLACLMVSNGWCSFEQRKSLGRYISLPSLATSGLSRYDWLQVVTAAASVDEHVRFNLTAWLPTDPAAIPVAAFDRLRQLREGTDPI